MSIPTTQESPERTGDRRSDLGLSWLLWVLVGMEGAWTTVMRTPMQRSRRSLNTRRGHLNHLGKNGASIQVAHLLLPALGLWGSASRTATAYNVKDHNFDSSRASPCCTIQIALAADLGAVVYMDRGRPSSSSRRQIPRTFPRRSGPPVCGVRSLRLHQSQPLIGQLSGLFCLHNPQNRSVLPP